MPEFQSNQPPNHMLHFPLPDDALYEICNCFMFCCALLYVHSSFAIILMGKKELVALLCLSSWCLVIVVWLFLTMPRVCLQFVIVVFPDHTHLLFCSITLYKLHQTLEHPFFALARTD